MCQLYADLHAYCTVCVESVAMYSKNFVSFSTGANCKVPILHQRLKPNETLHYDQGCWSICSAELFIIVFNPLVKPVWLFLFLLLSVNLMWIYSLISCLARGNPPEPSLLCSEKTAWLHADVTEPQIIRLLLYNTLTDGGGGEPTVIYKHSVCSLL